jgi:hypothetical protein
MVLYKIEVFYADWKSHLGFRIGIKNPNFLEDLQMIIPGHFGLNCPSGFIQALESLWYCRSSSWIFPYSKI